MKREVYLVNGQQPGPLTEADEGDDLEIFVQNDLPVEQTIHWHGLSPLPCESCSSESGKGADQDVLCRSSSTWYPGHGRRSWYHSGVLMYQLLPAVKMLMCASFPSRQEAILPTASPQVLSTALTGIILIFELTTMTLFAAHFSYIPHHHAAVHSRASLKTAKS